MLLMIKSWKMPPLNGQSRCTMDCCTHTCVSSVGQPCLLCSQYAAWCGACDESCVWAARNIPLPGAILPSPSSSVPSLLSLFASSSNLPPLSGREWYSSGSVLRLPSLLSRLLNALYDLSDLTFDLPCDEVDLNETWPTFQR